MKKVSLVIAVLVMACLVGSVYAQTPATPATPTAPAKPATPAKKAVLPKIVGEVVSVDTTANTVTVKDKAGKSETLNVDAKTVIKKSGKSSVLSDIAVGDKVIVRYKTEGDKKIATSIIVTVPPVVKEKSPVKK